MNGKSYVTTIDERDTKVRLDDISTNPKRASRARMPRRALRRAVRRALRPAGSAGRQDAQRAHRPVWTPPAKDGVVKTRRGLLEPARHQRCVVRRTGIKKRLSTTSCGACIVTPRLGEFALFNRSHHEDVLVVRVNNLVPRVAVEGTLRPHSRL